MITRRLVPGLLALSLTAGLLGGCDSPTVGEDTQVNLAVATPPRTALVGSTVETPIRFHLADAQGNPVAGRKVAFTASAGSSLQTAAQATDAAGNLDVLFTVGTTAGEYSIDAAVPGSSATARYTAVATTLKLDADSAVLALPVCGKSVSAKTFDNPDGIPDPYGRDVKFAATEPGIVELVVPLYHGMPIKQRIDVRPLKPGTTRVVAAYQGGSDTVVVRVFSQEELVPQRIRVDLPDTIAVPVGGNSLRPATGWVEGQGGCLLATARPAVSSANPEIAKPSQDFGSVYLFGQAPGDARIDFRYGSLSTTRTARVRHLRAAPADTTIRVGDVITYRLFTGDASGSFVEEMGATVHVFGSAASRRAGTAIVTGMTPGTSQVVVIAGGWEVTTPVRVVAR